jgi:glycerophosphoryl diester phosphodiesterase
MDSLRSNGIIARLSLFLLFITGCYSVKKQPGLPVTSFDKQGHRGCRGIMPENTIPAMLRALDLGCNTLEMDIAITADEKAILSHEPFYNHEITTLPNGDSIREEDERQYNIHRMTYAETLKFDVGLKPHPRFPQQQKMAVTKPLLLDMVRSVESYVKEKGLRAPFYNIETKTLPATDDIFHPAPEKFVDLLMNEILKAGISSRVIIQSFDFRTLQIIHRKFPGTKTAMLIEEDDTRTLEQQLDALGFLPDIYSPAYALVTKEAISYCHNRHIKVVPWTVNDQAKKDQLKLLGVDGIITDFP